MFLWTTWREYFVHLNQLRTHGLISAYCHALATPPTFAQAGHVSPSFKVVTNIFLGGRARYSFSFAVMARFALKMRLFKLKATRSKAKQKSERTIENHYSWKKNAERKGASSYCYRPLRLNQNPRKGFGGKSYTFEAAAASSSLYCHRLVHSWLV